MKINPLSQIKCYNCQKTNVTLWRCQNNMDYICTSCKDIKGLEGPEIGNQSRIYFKEKEKK